MIRPVQRGPLHLSRPRIAPVHVLPHIKKLDDCFGDCLVRVVCERGAVMSEPEALRRLVGCFTKG